MLGNLLNPRKFKWGRGAKARKLDRQRPMLEAFEPRMLLSAVTLAEWTYESAVAGSNKTFNADSGINQGVSVNSNVTSTDTSVFTGNGSAKAISYSNWAVGNYFQFATSTTGYDGISFSFDIRSTSTAPANFNVMYSTDGTNYTLLNSVTIASVQSWSGSSVNANSTFNVTVSDTSASNQSLVYFRVVDSGTTAVNGTTVATGGNVRIDNVKIVAANPYVTSSQSIGFDAPTVTVNEAAGTASITLTRIGANGSDLTGTATVQYSIQPGTAVAGTNYTDVSGTLTFSAGETSKTIVVPIFADRTNTNDLTFSVVLSDPVLTGATGGVGLDLAVSSTVVTIKSNEKTVQLSSASYSVNDNGGDAVFSVIRSGYMDDEATLTYTISGAISATGTVTFAAGKEIGTFTISVPDVSGDQAFTITLSSGSDSSVTLGQIFVANGKIVDATATGITNNLTGTSTSTDFTTAIEVSGAYGSTNYAAVVGDSTAGTSSFSYLAYQVLDFSTALTPSLYPSSAYQVTSVNNLTLSLYNTAVDGNYGGHVGNFRIYMVADGVDLSTLSYSTSVETGYTGGGILLGTFSFNNTLGYSDYSVTDLSQESQALLVAALNGGTAFRLVVTPDATGTGAIAADWGGNIAGKSPTLKISATTQQNYAIETISVGSTTYTVEKTTSNTLAITVTRSGDSISDAASVDFTTVNGSAIAGVDFTAASGTLHFAAGQASAIISIAITQNMAVYGDKIFSLVLSNPDDATSTGSVHVLGDSTTKITITDARTTTVSQNASQDVTIRPSGPYSNATYLNVEPASAGDYASYGVVEFNSYGTNGEKFLTLPEGYEIGNINSLTLSLMTAGPSAAYWQASGTINAYLVLVDENSPSIDPIFSTLHYTTDNAEGIGSDLGTTYFLGAMNFTASQTLGVYTDYVLNGFSSETEQLMISALSSGQTFRIVLASADGTAAGSFSGDFTTEGGELQSPKISFNLSPVQEAESLPSYITASEGAQYTWNSTTGQLSLTSGTLTFTDDAAAHSASINLSVDGANSSVVFNTTQHLAGLTLTNGAKATLAANGSHVLVINNNNLAVDSLSMLDLVNNDMILKGGNIETISSLLNMSSSSGNGLVASSVDSSTRLGYGKNDGSLLNFSTFDGESVDATDVIVKFTYAGDFDLNGDVNLFDYTRLLDSYGSTSASWTNGDANGDGVVNLFDYTALLDNYGKSGI